jgi:G:T-mismatch repair DNA endonuclease (very short patch repair protein)
MSSHGACDSCVTRLSGKQHEEAMRRRKATEERAEDLRRNGYRVSRIWSCKFKTNCLKKAIKRTDILTNTCLGETPTEQKILDAIKRKKLHGFIECMYIFL